METVTELVDRLRDHPDVVGLIEYGGARAEEGVEEGDYDCCAVVDWPEAPVESIHFFVGGVPVDLNVRALPQLRDEDVQRDFDASVLSGHVAYDPTGIVARLRDELTLDERALPPTPHDVARQRHTHRHTFDKIRGRLEDRPLLCRLRLNKSVVALVEQYFWFRERPWEGEKDALIHLEEHDPEVYELLQAYHGTLDLAEQFEYAERLAQVILEPIGGFWHEDELLAFCEDDDEDLQARGRLVYRKLFGP